LCIIWTKIGDAEISRSVRHAYVALALVTYPAISALTSRTNIVNCLVQMKRVVDGRMTVDIVVDM
jgi:hypothetical protein